MSPVFILIKYTFKWSVHFIISHQTALVRIDMLVYDIFQMWVNSVLTCWILFFMNVFSLVGSSCLPILLFRMSVHGWVVDDFCSFSLSVHQSWLIMLVLSEWECSPVSEASDPVCVWRHCTSHWPQLQALPGGCADHSPAGLPGPGGQGRLAAVLDKSDWTVEFWV